MEFEGTMLSELSAKDEYSMIPCAPERAVVMRSWRGGSWDLMVQSLSGGSEIVLDVGGAGTALYRGALNDSELYIKSGYSGTSVLHTFVPQRQGRIRPWGGS